MKKLAISLMAGAGALLASAMSEDWQRSATHAGVSIYLYAASFVIAAFVAHTPRAHTELIFRAWIAGALVAEAVLDLLGLDALEICPWALREGIILRRLDAMDQ